MGKSAYDRRLEASGLPPAVRLCLAGAGPALRAGARRDPGFLAGLGAFLAAAGDALGLGAPEALCFSGYRPGDATPGRLEAALAELGAALLLRAEGFTGIRPVARAAGRTADLRAERGGSEYYFEVRFVGGELGPAPERRLAAKFRSKAPQVRTSLKRSGGRGGGVIFSAGLPGFPRRDPALDKTAAAVHAACGGPGLGVWLAEGGRYGLWPPRG